MALVFLEADQPEKALEVLRRAPSSDSAVAALYGSLILGELGRWDEAQAAAERLTSLSPHNQFLPSLKSYLFLGQGAIEQALKSLEIGKPAGWVSWFRPELAAFPPLLSRLLLELEGYLLPMEFSQLCSEQARSDPEQIESPPQRFSPQALIHSVLGLYWQRKGLHYWEKGLLSQNPDKRHEYLEKALAAQRRAVQLEPLQFRGYYHLGEALLYSSVTPGEWVPDLQRLEEAERCLVHSWAQEGPNPYLYFYLGRTAQLRGQPLAAQTYLEKALEKFAKFPEAHYALGQIHLMMGQRSQAREWLKRSVSSDFLPVARDRLYELYQAFTQGKLTSRPAMPAWPPPSEQLELSPESVVVGESAVGDQLEAPQGPDGGSQDRIDPDPI